MANKAYRKGRYFENMIKKKLIEAGFYVTRSASSKGVFDLIAIYKGKVYGIQCKYDGKITKSEVNEMRKVAEEHTIIPIVAFARRRRQYVTNLHTNETFVFKDFIEFVKENA